MLFRSQNCQYSGLPQEEPTEFLAQFLQLADTVRDKEVDPLQQIWPLATPNFVTP